eukprot:jgi/Psemu1/8599/gm1.8599_g
MPLYSGTKETNYSLHWVDEKTLKIKLKWPIFMQNALLMTGLDVSFNAHGNTIENYTEGHQAEDKYKAKVFKFPPWLGDNNDDDTEEDNGGNGNDNCRLLPATGQNDANQQHFSNGNADHHHCIS